MSRESDPLLIAKGTKPTNWTDPTRFIHVEIGSQAFVVEPGVTRITSGHPLAKARPDLFRQDGQSEATTTQPRRRVRKPATK
jgi:hypothetical protein